MGTGSKMHLSYRNRGLSATTLSGLVFRLIRGRLRWCFKPSHVTARAQLEASVRSRERVNKPVTARFTAFKHPACTPDIGESLVTSG